ncbi:MAG: hypothetical protein OEX81_02070 [Candidatus Pacebacteria bacterium]|nr:hypothetical protein [Candidatus Paceibacterota bacterium]
MKTYGSIAVIIFLLVTSFGSVLAQDSFDFDNGAEMFRQVETVNIGGATNVRSVPSVRDNDPLFTARSSYIAEFVGEYEWSDGSVWNLGRFYNRSGNYVGFGWISRTAANVTTRTASYPTLRTGTCGLTTGGRQATVNVYFNDGWAWDSESTNCNVLVEGRPLNATNDTHHYWAVRDRSHLAGTGNFSNDAQITRYTVNGVVTALEGAVWEYPVMWNMSNLNAEDAPIFLEFANQKRDGGATYPLVLHNLLGQTIGITDLMLTDVVSEDTDNYDGLHAISVTGVRQANGSVVASVGSVDQCWLFIGQADVDEDLEVIRRCGMVEGFVFYTSDEAPSFFWVIPNQNTYTNDHQREVASEYATPALAEYIADFYGIDVDVDVDALGFGSHLRSGTYSVGL